ncbi:cupin domain-containing protein [Roseibium aggregatum]|uniref:Cupin domain-containing protein n=1 Tax=Roseibium aggregatum TaxID=187304 RepID=A0A939J1A2_9HYPH|nr:cupin domain-containing protein [Roseibium aggregatum]MBN9670123.1 cupin domain-containing protein [Roseibium aggregatum]
MLLSRLPLSLCIALFLAGTPSLAADKSVTPGGKPAPSQPHAKPGSKAAQDAEAADKAYRKVQEVFSGDTTVAGEKVAFPQTNPSVKALVVTMLPGEETEWHQHHAPMFAYLLEGEITVIYEELGKKIYRAGDGFLEAMDVTHRGVNTGEGPARVLSVYMLGDDGVPVVEEDAPGAEMEKVE